MKRLLVIVLLGVAGYFGYQYYLSNQEPDLPLDFSSGIEVKQKMTNAKDILNVLGESTSQIFEKGSDLLNDVTGGKSEPIVNKVVNDLKERVKELPEEEYRRVKYEFCKDVLTSPKESPKEDL